MDINEQGEVVGFSNPTTIPGIDFQPFGFVWSKGKGTKELPPLEGDVYSQAYANLVEQGTGTILRLRGYSAAGSSIALLPPTAASHERAIRQSLRPAAALMRPGGCADVTRLTVSPVHDRELATSTAVRHAPRRPPEQGAHR